MIMASAPFAWNYLLFAEFIEYSRSILTSLAFGSNIFFYANTTEYAAGPSLLKPFLHTWSLSIEEQFYVLFPAVFLAIWKLFKNHSIIIVLVGIVASLALAEYSSTRHTSANFYALPTRSWELLTGTLLTLLELKFGRRQRTILHRVLPALGLFLIVHSMLTFDEATRHPSLFTAIPVAGVALILFYSNKDELIGKFLGTRALVGLGLKIIMVLGTLLLSVFIYHIVETSILFIHFWMLKVNCIDNISDTLR